MAYSYDINKHLTSRVQDRLYHTWYIIEVDVSVLGGEVPLPGVPTHGTIVSYMVRNLSSVDMDPKIRAHTPSGTFNMDFELGSEQDDYLFIACPAKYATYGEKLTIYSRPTGGTANFVYHWITIMEGY